MKIALFPSSFAPHLGGVEELVRQLAHHLAAAGNSPRIYVNRWPKSLPRHEKFEGLDVRRYVFRVPERTIKQYAGAVLCGRSTLRNLCRDLRAHQAEVLHVQCVSSNAYYALQARRRLRLPLLVTLQGELTMDASGLFQRSRFAQDLLRQVITQADVVTACSGKTLEDAERFLGRALGAKATVIFNGASTQDFAKKETFPHPKPYVFAMGRLVTQKGFDVLMRAFAAAGISSHDLIIAGEGSERQALDALATSLPCSKSIYLIGRADHQKVVSLLNGASIFVLPSRSDEGLPIVCAEAMAAGKAIIATRSGGAPEAVIDGENGLIVAKEDDVGMTGALQRLLADRPLREKFEQRSLKRSQLFAWPEVTRQYTSAYAEALGRFQHRSISLRQERLSPT
jgi:glycosyltransferase involved in cell wall biosynthesis